uniref:Ribonucleoprotein, PTB binding 2 n=1 Tax=Serinus canaria TaxID=9135 RepID=A0A8C9MUK5_SERCA
EGLTMAGGTGNKRAGLGGDGHLGQSQQCRGEEQWIDNKIYITIQIGGAINCSAAGRSGSRCLFLPFSRKHPCEIHDLFKDYEIKYCYVDRNKRTAFVTLLNGEQAQSAIRRFHQHSLRGKEISVQLQPTDALLCITNLPLSLSIEEFEELVRAYGNVERCFLVYSELTGHSKGYGFVEYMKKDSAAKARLELLGKQLEESTLFAQWMDVNQLTTNLIHSKCLCVDKLQKDCADSKELLQAFSLKYKPVFCQFAQDEDGGSGDFAVLEYESAEQAESVRGAMDGATIHGRRLQVSFCAPGAPGRSTLAALIAAQRMMRNNRKGLLPEPNPVQIMKSFNNPAMLQMLLQPQLRGHAVKPGNSLLGSTSSLLLQSPAHLPLPQQQLLKMENMQANSKPGLLGEPPAVLLQTVLGIGVMPAVNSGLATRGEALKLEMPSSTSSAAGMGMLPFFPNQHIVGQALPGPNAAERPGPAEVPAVLGREQCSPWWSSCRNKGSSSVLQGFSPSTPLKKQTSLLGEPPKEIRLSTNPYLNLASVLPGICLPASSPPQQTSLPNNLVDAAVSQGTAPQHAMENYFSYSQQPGEYPQVGIIPQPGVPWDSPRASPCFPWVFFLSLCTDSLSVSVFRADLAQRTFPAEITTLEKIVSGEPELWALTKK